MRMPKCLRTRTSINAAKFILLLMLPIFALAQQKAITGTVKDETGALLPGISVSIKNSSGGTTTDAAGKFKLNAATGAEIVVSSATHESFSFKVDGKSDYVIALKLKAGALEDVVVVGYGRQKKVNLVGAVSSVKVD